MVTPLQLLKAMNSLAYRKRLEEGISDLEETIHRYMEENETEYVAIGGYSVSRENGSLIVNEVPPVNGDQLNLPLYADGKTYEAEKAI